MKMTSRCLLVITSILFAAASEARDDGKAGALRGGASRGSSDPQMQTVSGHYFGLHFDESPFAVNPWAVKKPAGVVDDLQPTAPFDRLDKNIVPSWSGAAPVAPGKTEAAVGYTHPDFVPPYLHPRPFPGEKPPNPKRDGIMVPIEDRNVVAHEDRLRLPGPGQDYMNPLAMYPLVAPADRISPGPWAVAHLDRVPANYDQFFDQSQMREAERKNQKELKDAFKRWDKDDDQAISSTEYDAEIQGHQKKTPEQAAVLWKQYHVSPDPDMNEEEFMKLAKTGFDLGQKFVKRSDIVATLLPPQAANIGYWGGGAACPEGKFITGVQIKVKPNSNSGDNTALNCVRFECEGGTTIQTAEGPDGAWTEMAKCLPGQTIASVSARVQPHRLGQDNTGINDLMFKCLSKGHEDATTLMFGENKPSTNQSEQEGFIFVNGAYIKKSETTVDDKKVVVGKGKVAADGGWSEELTCGGNAALCGAQGRLNQVDGAKDNLGVTDFRFFCCAKHVDCSAPCKDPTSTDCSACQLKVT